MGIDEGSGLLWLGSFVDVMEGLLQGEKLLTFPWDGQLPSRSAATHKLPSFPQMLPRCSLLNLSVPKCTRKILLKPAFSATP